MSLNTTALTDAIVARLQTEIGRNDVRIERKFIQAFVEEIIQHLIANVVVTTTVVVPPHAPGAGSTATGKGGIA